MSADRDQSRGEYVVPEFQSWPDAPSSPHEVLVMYLRSWGWEMANKEAHRTISYLARYGWAFFKMDQAAMGNQQTGESPILMQASPADES